MSIRSRDKAASIYGSVIQSIMKYESASLPVGSIERAKAQLENGDLIKAMKTCRQGDINIHRLQAELDHCLATLHQRRNFGLILSAYHQVGVFGKYTVEELLMCMAEAGDHPAFLKQAYRFDIFDGFEAQIECAIYWHIQKKLPDGMAWQRKFAKLYEQKELRVPIHLEELLVEDEGAVTQPSVPPVTYKLKPVRGATGRSKLLRPLPISDPYIISQTARVKMEQASQAHQYTLALLQTFLKDKNIPVSESKLIDNFCFLSGRPAIFEVKSITEDNEREQIRHAISQLYEYRFLHSLLDASLWIVFSKKPSSQWFIDYLLVDRTIHVLWIENGKLGGPSVKQIG